MYIECEASNLRKAVGIRLTQNILEGEENTLSNIFPQIWEEMMGLFVFYHFGSVVEIALDGRNLGPY